MFALTKSENNKLMVINTRFVDVEFFDSKYRVNQFLGSIFGVSICKIKSYTEWKV